MHVSNTIDWLQFSTPRFLYGAKISGNREIVRSPNRFYQWGMRLDGDVLVLSGNPNTQKSLVIMSGKSCEVYRKVLPDVLSNEMSNGAKVSRIDLCVTVDDASLLGKFKQAVTKREVISRRLDVDKSKAIVNRDGATETQYVGDLSKRASKGIFRAYDKGIQLGIDKPLARFELECKRNIAHNNAKRWLDGVTIGNMIRKSVDLPKHQWWVDLMGTEVTVPQVGPDAPPELTDAQRRWRWLCKQVAPALGKAIADDVRADGTTPNFDRFNQLVQKAFRQQNRR